MFLMLEEERTLDSRILSGPDQSGIFAEAASKLVYFKLLNSGVSCIPLARPPQHRTGYAWI